LIKKTRKEENIMKKIVLSLVIFLFSCQFLFQQQINALPTSSCTITSTFCFEDEDPDNVVNVASTFIVAMAVDQNMNYLGLYTVYVNVNDNYLDIRTSVFYLREITSDPNPQVYTTESLEFYDFAGLTSDVTFVLKDNVTVSQWKTNDLTFVNYMDRDLYSVMVGVAYGSIHYANQTVGTLRGYIDRYSRDILLCQYDGMSGTLGRYILGLNDGTDQFDNTHITNFTFYGIYNTGYIDITTNYTSLYYLPTILDSRFEKVIVVNFD